MVQTHHKQLELLQITERMRIDSSGRLLLGTTTEGYHDADDLIRVQSASGYTGHYIKSSKYGWWSDILSCDASKWSCRVCRTNFI